MNVTSHIEQTEAYHRYATAYATHYTEHNLPSAMRQYSQVMVSHPEDPEAEYARVQIQNIVSAVVPRQAILAALMQLANSHFELSTTP